MVNGNFDWEEFRERFNRPGEWVFVVPVSGVRLSSAVNNEFRIKRVLLISKDKLPRVRKRLGIPQRISQMHERHRDFFASSDVFAVIRHSGIPQETKTTNRRIVQDELSILALSQLGYMKRRLGACPSIKGQPVSGKKEGFFLKLLKVLNNEIGVARSWRNELERAAILLGQSQCCSDVAQSFLWNMIALEILLTRQGDKYTDVLPTRIEAFLGWVGFWTVENYFERIQKLYRKRSAFVHDGKRVNISIPDLLFTDDLLLNLLINLMHHINLFNSKDAVIEFSKKVEAERVLGVRPRVRPKSLRFFSSTYTDRDYQEI